MAKTIQDWTKAVGQGLLTTAVLALIPGSAVAYLAHIQSLWTLPLLEGLGGSMAAIVAIGAIRAVAHLPPKRTMPSPENIEACIRKWLDTYKVTVKNDPHRSNYFCLRLTLDGGTNLTVLRNKEDYPEYVQIISDLGIRGDNKGLLDAYSEDEKTQLMCELKLELARARVGYGGLVEPPENFHLLRRVPIQHNLTEFGFMGMIGEIEAATNLVLIIFLKSKIQIDTRLKREAIKPPLLASDTPILELPPTSS